MTRKCLLILVVVLIPMMVVSAYGGWTPAIELSVGYYGAIPLADYLKTVVPVRTQASGKVYVDPLCFTFERFQVGAAFYADFVSPSLSYGTSCLKGFIGIGGRLYAGYFLTECYLLGLGAEIGINYMGLDVQFGSIAGIIYNEFLLFRKPYVDISLLAPAEVSYRKDILAVSLSVGVKFKYKGYWIIEEDL